MQATFEWACSYMGCTWYRVSDHTGTYEAEFRRCAEPYELSIANGDDCRRDMQAAIGILRRNSCGNGRLFEVPQSTVDAFNAWRIAERAKHVAEMKSQPHRYGEINENDKSLFPPILTARQGHYVMGVGWQS